MKNLNKVAAVFAVISLFAVQSVFAASVSTAPIAISATVPGALTISAVLHKNASTGAIVPSMDFGTLVDTGTGTLRSSIAGSTGTGSVVAVISAVSSGLPYTITQTGTTATSGADTLPAGACTVVPVYSAADNGGAALVGALGAAGTWVAAGKTVYTSDAAGTFRIIQAHYSVTDDPAAGATTVVPLSQPSGAYAATVTFTVTA